MDCPLTKGELLGKMDIKINKNQTKQTRKTNQCKPQGHVKLLCVGRPSRWKVRLAVYLVLPVTWGQILSWQSLVEKLAAFKGFCLTRNLCQNFKKPKQTRKKEKGCSSCSVPPCGSLVSLWSVWTSSTTVQCFDRLSTYIYTHTHRVEHQLRTCRHICSPNSLSQVNIEWFSNNF